MTADTETYRLRDSIDAVIRADLVLDGDETIALLPDNAATHDDILVAVGDADTTETEQ